VRAVAISLKIPDNTAYTALVALRRLGVEVDRIERSEITFFDDECDAETLRRRIIADETIFNPNKHRFTVLEDSAPRAGEVWIEPLEPGRRATRLATAWRLFDALGAPVDRAVLSSAVDRLLCNPAVERAKY
jgi:phosphoribosylformylglycinamidine (FGAM) synthase PurS component